VVLVERLHSRNSHNRVKNLVIKLSAAPRPTKFLPFQSQKQRYSNAFSLLNFSSRILVVFLVVLVILMISLVIFLVILGGLGGSIFRARLLFKPLHAGTLQGERFHAFSFSLRVVVDS